MPRTSKQNREIKERRRNEILLKALELFSKYGYNNVKMDDISKAVKCSHGLLYHYFESKDVLSDELDRIAVTRYVDALEEIYKTCNPGLEFLNRALGVFIDQIFNSEVDAYYVLAFVNFKLRSIEPSRLDLNYQKKYYNSFIKSFEIIKEDGVIRKDADLNQFIINYFCYIQGLALCKVRFHNVDLKKPDSTNFLKVCI